ncbi:hypothetical protein [Cellulomonas cellasea]|uniref:aldose epimerase family protein n=1 Tax=Cellulomonas cellasea TaxID=43670 RepID=UPI001FE98F15|nr:hypothetical protein [Cellulomonas cellasea]
MTTETSTRTPGAAPPAAASVPELLTALTAPDPADVPVDPRVVTLRSGSWELGVLPATGGSLAFGRVLVDGEWLDLLRPTRPTVYGAPEKCASFPLVPWSNRIRDGVLRFRGRTWTLAHNAADGTAMHGAVAYYTWRVVDRTAARVELELDTRGLVGVNFPWQFRSRLVYELDGADLRVTTTVENVDTEPFPAGFGTTRTSSAASRPPRSRRPRRSPVTPPTRAMRPPPRRRPRRERRRARSPAPTPCCTCPPIAATRSSRRWRSRPPGPCGPAPTTGSRARSAPRSSTTS